MQVSPGGGASAQVVQVSPGGTAQQNKQLMQVQGQLVQVQGQPAQQVTQVQGVQGQQMFQVQGLPGQQVQAGQVVQVQAQTPQQVMQVQGQSGQQLVQVQGQGQQLVQVSGQQGVVKMPVQNQAVISQPGSLVVGAAGQPGGVVVGAGGGVVVPVGAVVQKPVLQQVVMSQSSQQQPRQSQVMQSSGQVIQPTGQLIQSDNQLIQSGQTVIQSNQTNPGAAPPSSTPPSLPAQTQPVVVNGQTATPPPAVSPAPTSTSASPSPPPQPRINPSTPFLCEWAGCLKAFKTPKEVENHAIAEHCPLGSDDIPCMWQRCDGMKRKRFSLMTHLQDRHCHPQLMKLMAVRRVQIAQSGKSDVPLPPAPPPHPGYAPNAALHAIKRHAVEFVSPKELAMRDEKEGPVTKSIRLTSSLILRNLVIYSSIGKSRLRAFESHLSTVALSNVESSRTVSQILYDMNVVEDFC